MKQIIATFVLCGAALGWAGGVVVSAGGATGWLLVMAAVCCFIVAYGEHKTRIRG